MYNLHNHIKTELNQCRKLQNFHHSPTPFQTIGFNLKILKCISLILLVCYFTSNNLCPLSFGQDLCFHPYLQKGCWGGVSNGFYRAKGGRKANMKGFGLILVTYTNPLHDILASCHAQHDSLAVFHTLFLTLLTLGIGVGEYFKKLSKYHLIILIIRFKF